jgi:hypothetical protein
MEYEQFEAYKGPNLTLRQLDNHVRRLIGDYGNAPVTFKSTKTELTILVGRPQPGEDPQRITVEEFEAENKKTNRDEHSPEVTKQYV